MIAKKDPITGIEKLIIEDDDDEDDEDKPKPLTMEERQIKAQKEREEKQKKYEEVRERLFGATSNPPSSSNSPGAVTPPKGRVANEKGRGRGRGGVSKDSSIQAGGSNNRQLYDPSYSAKPDSAYVQKQAARSTDARSKATGEDHVIRQPKAPDGSGRGGIGFMPRGRRAARP